MDNDAYEIWRILSRFAFINIPEGYIYVLMMMMMIMICRWDYYLFYFGVVDFSFYLNLSQCS